MILRDIDNIPDLFVIPSIKKIDSKLLIVSNSRIQNYTTIDSIIDLFVVFVIYIYAYLFYYIIMLTLQIRLSHITKYIISNVAQIK